MELMTLVPRSKQQLNVEESLGPPRTDHTCLIPPEFDELENMIVGKGICAKTLRWLRKQCLVYKNHPDTRLRLRSKAAIAYEYFRHATSYRYMVHPFSKIRIYWELLMITATIISLLVIPVRITFYFEIPTGKWLALTTMLTMIFVIDFVLSFMTGYHDLRTNVVVLEPRLVARNYITGWFFVDLIASLPVALIAHVFDPTETNILLYNYIQALKFFRIRLIMTYGRRLRRFYNMSFRLHKSLELMIVVVMVLHWAACAEYFVAYSVQRVMQMNGSKTHSNWISLYYRKKEDVIFTYTICLYRAVAAMVGSLKYDRILALEDSLVDIFLSIFGRIANIYLIAQWFQVMNTFSGTSSTYHRLLPQLREYMRQKELPIELQKQLTTYYQYCAQRGVELEKNIMRQVSAQLKEELMLHRYRQLVAKLSFIKYLPNPVITSIIMSLRAEFYLPNEIIIRAGTIGDVMYFIGSGTVAVYTSLGKEVCHLDDGAHFGEISVIMENETRLASVVAVEVCELYTLSREDFQQVIAPYPDLMNSLQKLAIERLEKTLLLGDIYRLEGNIPDAFSQQRSKSSNKRKNKIWNYLYPSVFISYYNLHQLPYIFF